jgi:hypothetical protein
LLLLKLVKTTFSGSIFSIAFHTTVFHITISNRLMHLIIRLLFNERFPMMNCIIRRVFNERFPMFVDVGSGSGTPLVMLFCRPTGRHSITITVMITAELTITAISIPGTVSPLPVATRVPEVTGIPDTFFGIRVEATPHVLVVVATIVDMV